MMQRHIELLTAEIGAQYGCRAEYLRTVPVAQLKGSEDVWQSDVEVFRLDRIDATRAYAWCRIRNGRFQCTIVLGVPPVDSAAAAVAQWRATQAGPQRQAPASSDRQSEEQPRR
jgi:hypothetical protein